MIYSDVTKAKSSILLIYTGGTIGMKEDPAVQALRPFDFSQILEEVPELGKFAYRIDSNTFDPIIDSSDVEPSLWVSLAGLIEERYDSYDGFVILHGTDTMAYSASALSFMIEGLTKPVVFTGSQLPIGTPRTDGKENLISSNPLTLDITAEGVMLYTFSKLHTEAHRTERISDKIMKLTKELFSNPSLSITTIGEKLSYNPKYLSHIFKEETKMSYTEYLQITRINYAIMLFENGIDSIKNVSLLSGFNDPFYFSVVFKKHTGVAPKDYINANK